MTECFLGTCLCCPQSEMLPIFGYELLQETYSVELQEQWLDIQD